MAGGAARRRRWAERLRRRAGLGEGGMDDEQATATVLAALPQDEWTVLRDVRWPGRRYANIDQIVVSRGGVFVIDSNAWSGSVTVRDQVLRLNGHSRDAAVVAAVEAGLAVSLVTPSVPTRHVQPVLCFVREEPIAGLVHGVIVCSTSTLVQVLLSRPVVLDETQVRQASLELELALRRVATAGPLRSSAQRGRPRGAINRSRGAGSGAGVSGPASRMKMLLMIGVLLVLLGVTQLSSVIGEGVMWLFTHS